MNPTTAERLKQITDHWIAEGWQKGDETVVHRLHSPDFIDHDPAGRRPDNQGFKQGIQELYHAFPDWYGVVEDYVIDENAGMVAVRWAATGTHKGTFLGFSPSGRQISFKGIDIIRIQNERIVERWGEWDGLNLLDQLKTRKYRADEE